ncbi:MAG: hypothetical protein IIZ04_03075, partial [Aeriscardovia sp.]|nr:hypothetical protein [Aeriscardovia sp.]
RLVNLLGFRKDLALFEARLEKNPQDDILDFGSTLSFTPFQLQNLLTLQKNSNLYIFYIFFLLFLLSNSPLLSVIL